MADYILEQTAEEVQRAINKSLESGVYIGSGDMPEGYDIQIDPSGDNSVVDGVIITVPVDGWVSNDGGTYTNTIIVDGVTSTTTYDVSLYGDITEEQATAYSESITSVTTNEGQIVITASESITVELQLLLRGRINFSEQSVVYLKDPKAINMSYDNSSSKLTATNVQSAVDELNGDINELNSKLDSFVIKHFTTDKVTIGALQGTSAEITNVKLEGYRLVFAVPGWQNGTSAFLAMGCTPLISDNKVIVAIRNFTNAEATGSYTVNALFIKE